MKCYTADFETTTDIDDCRVWAWAICDIDNDEHVVIGIDIEGFFRYLDVLPDCRVYFHNLSFDVSFIFDYLLNNGYVWESQRYPKYVKGFSTMISDMNQVYSVRINLSSNHHVTLFDSYKVVPLSIAQAAKAFGLSFGKGEIDYTAKRDKGYKLTEEEKDYISRDVRIDAQVMREVMAEGLKSMTIGACALSDYKKMMGGTRGFRYHYPILDADQDKFIRRAYRGGYCYAAKRYQGLELGEGISFDVNSLYPSVMASSAGEYMPYGVPKWFATKPSGDCWIAMLTLSAKLKEKHIPCIQIKGNIRFKPTEYLENIEEPTTITITSIDWELINQQYEVCVYEWHGGYSFKQSTDLFSSYVDKWVAEKNRATVEGNSGKRQIAKLMLNSLYGKFATGLELKSRYPTLDSEGVVRYKDTESVDREGVYLPAACFITAWSRYKTVRAAQNAYDRFIYSDTDSIKVLGVEPVTGLDVDDVRLGAWKNEGTFNRFKVLRAKTYIADMSRDLNKKLSVHVAGMPARCHKQVTFDNFKLGATYQGKLYQTRVRGGIILIEDSFTIQG